MSKKKEELQVVIIHNIEYDRDEEVDKTIANFILVEDHGDGSLGRYVELPAVQLLDVCKWLAGFVKHRTIEDFNYTVETLQQFVIDLEKDQKEVCGS